jgi:GGDEF domain-containing protein
MTNVFTGSVPDQYYVVTARLTAQGHQRTTMRVVAGCILTLGLPALLAATNPQASNIPGGRALLALIPLGCVALASPWLRYRWPTRAQSMAIVIIGALALSAGCIVAINPFSGMLVATAFPFILGYTVLFHGMRLQVLVSVLAGGTIAWLAIRIAIEDVPTAIAVTTPVVLINVAVLVASRIIAEVSASRDQLTDIEPLTGLLTRRSFDDAAGTLLGSRNRDDDRYLVVAVITIDGFAARLSLQGDRGANQARIAVAQALRETVRRDAVIGHVDETEFLVIDIFTTADPSPLAERIRSAVASTPGGVTASVGMVSTPLRPLTDLPPSDVLDEAIARATTAMFQARRRGGNATECVAEHDQA